MAYSPKDKMFEQQPGQSDQQQPSAPNAPSLGSTGSFGGTVGNVGTGGLSKQGAMSQDQSPAGTGFVNIDRILGANQNAGTEAEKVAGDISSKEQGDFNSGLNKTRSDIKTNSSNIYDPKDVVNYLGTDTTQHGRVFHEVTAEEAQHAPEGWVPDRVGDKMGYYTDEITAPDDRSGAIKNAQNAINQTYKGPASYEYNVGQTDNAYKLRGLSDSRSAGATLAQNQGSLASYNPGLSAIDQAIYGSSGVNNSIQNIGKNSQSLFSDQAQKQGDVSNEAKAASDAISKNSADVRDALSKEGDRLRNSGAISGTDGAVHTLQAIGKVLGDPNLSSYASPKPSPTPTVAPQPTPAVAPAAPAAPQFSGEPLKAYQRYIALGYSPTQATQAVKTSITSGGGEYGDPDVVEAMRQQGFSQEEIKAYMKNHHIGGND